MATGKWRKTVLRATLLVALVSLIVSVVGCTKPAPAPATTKPPATATTKPPATTTTKPPATTAAKPPATTAAKPPATAAKPAAPAVKPIVLKYTSFEPAPPPSPQESSSPTVRLGVWLGKEIEAKTNGRVKLEYYWGQTLGKSQDFLKMTGRSGVADIAYVSSTTVTWDIPLTAGGFSLPFMTSSIPHLQNSAAKLYREWPAIAEEWRKWNLKPFYFNTSGTYALFVKTDKPITKLDDLAGLKARGVLSYADILKEFGLTHVGLGTPEVYDAMQKGVLNAVIQPFGNAKAFGFHEVSNRIIDFTWAGGTTVSGTAINIDVWNKISPEDQKAIEEIASRGAAQVAGYIDVLEKEAAAYYKSQGLEIITFSPAEQARIKDRSAEKIWAAWVTAAKQRGVPSEEFLTRWKAVTKEVQGK